MRLVTTTFIAGTTIGAGMLALPMSAFNIGYVYWIGLSVFFWSLMSFTGIVQADLNTHFNKSISIASISKLQFGRFFELIAQVSIFGLFYALLSAYATGAAQILHSNVFKFSFNFSLITYVTVLGFFIASCFSFVDYLNRFLVIIKFIVFFVVITFLFNYSSLSNIKPIGSFKNALIAVPVFFTAFGFHGSIPSLFEYVNKNTKSVKFGIVFGSLTALLVYLLWQTIALGCIQYGIDSKTSLSEFVHHLSSVSKNSSFETIVGVFIFFGVSTSFLGVGIGLFDYIKEKVHSKLLTAVLTFLPPIIFAIIYPSGFIFALRFAAVFLSIIAVILPTINAIKITPGVGVYKISMYFALVVGFAIILIDMLC